MPDAPISFSSGLPETVLAAEPADVLAALDAAIGVADIAGRRDAVAMVAARWPRSVTTWAHLGELGRDSIERYAAFRVGYHRGLDALRGSGWKGSGYVRWRHESNRGFLRAVDGLRRCAAEIGETDEVERCTHFLLQLDPDWERRPDAH